MKQHLSNRSQKCSYAVTRPQIASFTRLLEGAPFGFYVVDSQLRIAHMNASSQNGAFRNVRPVIGRDIAEAMRILWPEPIAREIISHFRHTLDTGEQYISPRFTSSRNDLSTVESYEWELHRTTLPSGQNGVVCYYYNSTRFREAEDAMEQQARQLKELAQSLDSRVKERTSQLQTMAQELAETEHRERTRVAQVLHDGLQQYLVAARMYAELVVKASQEEERRECGRRLDELMAKSISVSRSLTLELCPPGLNEESLGSALKWLARWMAEKHQFQVDLALAADAEPTTIPKRLVLFQCARELLLNAVKHSGTRQARVSLWREPHGPLWLEVVDSGKGCRHAPGDSGTAQGFGLSSLRQRVALLGGTLEIKSKPGKGTQVGVSIPLAGHGHPAGTVSSKISEEPAQPALAFGAAGFPRGCMGVSEVTQTY